MKKAKKVVLPESVWVEFAEDGLPWAVTKLKLKAEEWAEESPHSVVEYVRKPDTLENAFREQKKQVQKFAKHVEKTDKLIAKTVKKQRSR